MKQKQNLAVASRSQGLTSWSPPRGLLFSDNVTGPRPSHCPPLVFEWPYGGVSSSVSTKSHADGLGSISRPKRALRPWHRVKPQDQDHNRNRFKQFPGSQPEQVQTIPSSDRESTKQQSTRASATFAEGYYELRLKASMRFASALLPTSSECFHPLCRSLPPTSSRTSQITSPNSTELC